MKFHHKLLLFSSSVGFNGDCSVIFVNGIDPVTVEGSTARAEFIPVGNVNELECRVDTEIGVGQYENGDFGPCKFLCEIHHAYHNL